MIHQITKAFDDRDERGIDCNIWMKLYEAIENYDRDDNIYQGVIANGFDFNSAMNIIALARGATMLENPPRSHP